MKFGVDDLSQSATTSDVSATGCFIIHTRPPPLHKRIHLQIYVEGEKFVLYEATVRRVKEVPPELRQIERNGFGVQFLPPEDLLSEVLPHLGSAQQLFLSVANGVELKRLFNQEIRSGGLFVRSDKKVPRDTCSCRSFYGWSSFPRTSSFEPRSSMCRKPASGGLGFPLMNPIG